MNLLKSVSTFFSGIVNSLRKVFGSPTFKKAESVAKAVGDLLAYALPAVEFVASLTPNKADDEIVAMIKKLQVATAIDLDAVLAGQSTLSKADRTGLLTSAAAEVLRGNLKDAILSSGGVGIWIAGELVKSATDIPDNWVNTAVNAVYTVAKAAKS